jgi:hypothetical protein
VKLRCRELYISDHIPDVDMAVCACRRTVEELFHLCSFHQIELRAKIYFVLVHNLSSLLKALTCSSRDVATGLIHLYADDVSWPLLPINSFPILVNEPDVQILRWQLLPF